MHTGFRCQHKSLKHMTNKCCLNYTLNSSKCLCSCCMFLHLNNNHYDILNMSLSLSTSSIRQWNFHTRNKYYLHLCNNLANNTSTKMIHYILNIRAWLRHRLSTSYESLNNNQAHIHNRMKYFGKLHSREDYQYKWSNFHQQIQPELTCCHLN